MDKKNEEALEVIVLNSNKGNSRNLAFFLILQVLIIAFVIFYFDFIKPKTSLGLYQSLSFAEDYEEAKQFMLEGYEKNLDESDFQYISELGNIANQINQFTLFIYNDKTYMLMTTPGKKKLEVLSVEELPEEIRTYFLEFWENIE